MSTLKTRLTDDMKAAMKSGDKQRLGTIRLIQAAIKQCEVDERIQLDDAQVLHVLEKMLKQRRDSVAQYENAQREDLAAQERYEIDVIEAYLPAQLSESEIDVLIASAIADSGAASARDMGKVMALLKERAAGRADFGALSQKVKAKLGVE
ncbi:MAG: glutamyl-tRNA amidotransferase [Rhodanobacteraceae bacterium]